MDPVIITDPKQIRDVPPGASFIISPPGFGTPDHDPEQFADAYRELAEKVRAEQDEPDETADPVVAVEFNETHLLLTANEDLTVEVGGDIASPGDVNLRANRQARRKLKDNAEAVTVDGVMHPVKKG